MTPDDFKPPAGPLTLTLFPEYEDAAELDAAVQDWITAAPTRPATAAGSADEITRAFVLAKAYRQVADRMDAEPMQSGTTGGGYSRYSDKQVERMIARAEGYEAELAALLVPAPAAAERPTGGSVSVRRVRTF